MAEGPNLPDLHDIQKAQNAFHAGRSTQADFDATVNTFLSRREVLAAEAAGDAEQEAEAC